MISLIDIIMSINDLNLNIGNIIRFCNLKHLKFFRELK